MIAGVELISIGSSAATKLDLAWVARAVAQPHLPATARAPITDLPLPSGPQPPYTSSRQYEPQQLFDLVEALAPPPAGWVSCAAVDHEVYNEVFSCTDSTGRFIVISLRNSTLHTILAAAGSTLEQYFMLELALQLLAIRYRQLNANPTPGHNDVRPWHLDRRGCLFDYFGISPQDTAKLVNPKLCATCSTALASDPDLTRLLHTLQPTLHKVSHRNLAYRTKTFMSDPINSFLAGAVAGSLPALFNNNTVATDSLGCVLVVGLLARALWRRSKP